jgi:protein-disulfide isomerase
VKKTNWAGTSVVAVVLGLGTLGTGTMMAQAAGPVMSPATQAAEPQAPRPTAAAANPFPAVNLKNFTADSPTRADVDSFLTAIWGYDPNRIWSVAGILKTLAPGVAKVVVFVGDKLTPGKGTTTVFFITPDGKHAIADNVIDFGVKPFAAPRKVLQDRANGPAEGATGKDLMLVEFADLQDPKSKEAQDTMNNLVKDFPQARIVVENIAVNDTHRFAARAAAEGYCVAKANGNAAFFLYEQAVFDKQDLLAAATVDATLSAAVSVAGGDPKAATACAATEAAKASVIAANTLASDIGTESTPVLVVNGHALPVNAVKYETLKQIIAFQAGQDGITVHVQPTLSNVK